MQKKAVIWTAVATTAAAIAIYYIRKRKIARTDPAQKNNYPNHVVTRTRGVASGEYTL